MKNKNTIKMYRSLETEQLKMLLNSFETAQNNTENIMENVEKRGGSVYKLEEKISDFDIDIHVIRLELTKRLWKESKIS